MRATDRWSMARDVRRIRVRRHPDRGIYDRETIDSILDEAIYCHVGFVEDGQPFVIPTIHARDGDVLYLHGSRASRMIRTLGKKIPLCITVTLLDGIVLARSQFHHSLNYRSVVVLGEGRAVKDEGERLRALECVVDHVLPGRSVEARPPTAKELKATDLIAVDLDEASAKVRSGPPKDDDEDMDLPIWAGVVPLTMQALRPVPADGSEEMPLPASVEHLMHERDPGG